MMWREQGKDQMPQCFMSNTQSRLRVGSGRLTKGFNRYFLRIG
jgi:hypothetical protein